MRIGGKLQSMCQHSQDTRSGSELTLQVWVWEREEALYWMWGSEDSTAADRMALEVWLSKQKNS